MAEVIFRFSDVQLPGRERLRLRDVSVDITSGVTAIIGQSGAGKSSLLNVMVGFEKVKSGVVESQTRDKGFEMGLFWSPGDSGLWNHLTARKHLEYVTTDKQGIDELLAKFDLVDVAKARPGTLSQGERSRLAVARAMAANPAVLVLDEPLVHVDPARIGQYWRVVMEHIERTGCSLVFTTHRPGEVLAYAEQVVCMDEGQVVYSGSVGELYDRPRDEKLARFLGEVNWFESGQAKQWFSGEVNGKQAYRPEQVRVTVDKESGLVVRQATFCGLTGEMVVENEADGTHRTIVHQPGRERLKVGDRVRIWMAVLVAACAFLYGCGEAEQNALEVKVFDTWSIPADEGRLPAPRSVTTGPNDEVLVLDDGGRVLVYASDGELLRKWDMPTNEDGNAEGACWLKDGRIAVADTHYYRILFFDDQGNLLSSMGEYGTEGKPGTFQFPMSIVQDDEENLYISEYGGGDRIQKFTKDGEYIKSFGSVGTGPGQFQRAAGMVWHDGLLYIADASNGRVQVYTDEGKFIKELAGADGQVLTFDFPYDVAMDDAGYLYVIEWGAGRVVKVSADGEVQGFYGKAGSGHGEFRTPWSVAVDSQRRLRVADTQNRRIVELIF